MAHPDNGKERCIGIDYGKQCKSEISRGIGTSKLFYHYCYDCFSKYNTFGQRIASIFGINLAPKWSPPNNKKLGRFFARYKDFFGGNSLVMDHNNLNEYSTDYNSSKNEVLHLCMEYDIAFKPKPNTMSYGKLICLVCRERFSDQWEFNYHAKGWQHKRTKDGEYGDLLEDPYEYIKNLENEKKRIREKEKQRKKQSKRASSVRVTSSKPKCESWRCSKDATKVCRWCRKNRCDFHHRHCCSDDDS